MINRASLLFTFALVFLGCPMPTPTPDGGGSAVTPVLTSLSPDRGPLAGNTVVTLNGSSFVQGATVTIGGVPATTSFETDKRLSVTTPSGVSVGPVSVTVTNPGGKSSTLNTAFTYEANVTRVIRDATLTTPDSSDTSGSATVSVTVIANVDIPGVTTGTGKGSGVLAQVGFASQPSPTPTPSEFTWVDATYLGDVDGAASGDKARDSYSGMVTLPGSTGAQQISFVTARFSVDGGQTWTIADRDGSMNGTLTTQLARVTVLQASVGWCKLGGQAVTAPPMEMLRGSASGPTIYGQVYQSGITDMVGGGAGIKGALGYGVAGTQPSTWTWVAASFNVDTAGGANDEFQAVLPNPGAGTYKFAFRFNLNDGPWTYCDADGLDQNGFTEDQAGTLTVAPLQIDSCVLHYPSVLTTAQGQASSLVYGRVLVQGLTEATGAAGSSLEGQLGFGTGGDPTLASWSWTPATFNIDDGGGGEEYQATLLGPSPGTYAYAYRFRVNQGAWTYCDLDGSTNGTQAAQLGALTASSVLIQSCRLSSVSAFSIASGSALTSTARVLIPAVTAMSGAAPNLRVQIGVGPQGNNASMSALWGWQNASFSNDIGGTGEDEFTALTFPAYTGSRAVSARASLDGTNWTYCDLNGSDVGGYEVGQQYDVTVTNHVDLDFCNLQAPSSGQRGGTIFGQVFEPTVTPNASAPITAQLGLGVESEDPGLAWRWTTAAFNVTVGNNNEYQAAIPADAGVGLRYAYRYTLDGGSWCFGDLDGNQNGFSGGANIGTVIP